MRQGSSRRRCRSTVPLACGEERRRCCWEAYQRKLSQSEQCPDGKNSQLVAKAATVQAPQSAPSGVQQAARLSAAAHG
eukprot:4321846-Pleurochrysis_carterae.AAC.1